VPRGVRQVLPTEGVEHTRTYRIVDSLLGCRNELVEACVLVARKPPVHSDYDTNGKDEGSNKMDEPHVRHHKRLGISGKKRGADVKSVTDSTTMLKRAASASTVQETPKHRLDSWQPPPYLNLTLVNFFPKCVKNMDAAGHAGIKGMDSPLDLYWSVGIGDRGPHKASSSGPLCPLASLGDAFMPPGTTH